MPTDFLAAAKPVKQDSDFLANATPARPAGLPAGVDLPQLPVHSAVTMNAPKTIAQSFDENTAYNSNDPAIKKVLAGTVNAVGSPFIHPINTAKGMIQGAMLPIGDNAPKSEPIPWADTAKEIPYNAGQLIGGTALGSAGSELLPHVVGIPSDVANLVPTRAKAGAILDSLNKDLATHPVPLNESLAPLQSMAEYGEAGAQLPGAANKLLLRSQSPFPLEYPEARRFQQTLSSLSRADRDALSGSQGGNLKQLNKGLFNDIRDSAETVGRGEDFEKGMRDYRRATQINNGLTWAAKRGIPALVGTGVAAEVAHKLLPGK